MDRMIFGKNFGEFFRHLRIFFAQQRPPDQKIDFGAERAVGVAQLNGNVPAADHDHGAGELRVAQGFRTRHKRRSFKPGNHGDLRPRTDHNKNLFSRELFAVHFHNFVGNKTRLAGIIGDIGVLCIPGRDAR